MSNNALNLNCNVTLKVIDSKQRVLREIHIHNKANRALVDGLLQFLQGAFTPSQFNDPAEVLDNPESTIISNAYSAKPYIPSCMGFGSIGIRYETVDGVSTIDQNTLDYVKPNFYETSLQDELHVPRVKFKKLRQAVGSDLNNSESIVMTTVLPLGYLVYDHDESGNIKYDENGNPIYRDLGYFTDLEGNRACIITEVGLFSNTSEDQGLMLARILLDGEFENENGVLTPNGKRGKFADESYQYNPLIQTDKTAILIEWKIGIVSLGTNDEFIVSNPGNSNDSNEVVINDRSIAENTKVLDDNTVEEDPSTNSNNIKENNKSNVLGKEED